MPSSVDALSLLDLDLVLVPVLLLLTIYISPASASILPNLVESTRLQDNNNIITVARHQPLTTRNATRDPRLLPAQISGIVGAYIFSVCVVGVLILALGRRRRDRIAGIGKSAEIEMVTGHYGPSPISPASPSTGPRNFSWPSPDTKEQQQLGPYIFPSTARHSGATTLPRSPPGYGDPHVDRRVVEADREMLNRDLEDIYAHVMEQEAAKAAGVKLKEMPLPVPLQHVGPVPPPAPQRAGAASPPKKAEKNRPANLALWEPESPKPQSRTASIISALKSPRKKSMRAMRISSPIPTPISATFPSGHASDEEPLSPRYYKPPPPPPVPRDSAPYSHSRNTSLGPSPISPTRSIAEQLNPYPPSVSTRYHHQANRSQASMHSQASTADPMSATSATSQTPLVAPVFPLSSPRPRPANGPTTSHPPPLTVTTLNPAPAPSSANSSTRALPLRQFEPALASPSFQHITKTTVLERMNPLSPALRTGGLPWSPGAVPYSPYQPFSPMVPITPTLVTKEQRKKMKKREPRTPVVEMVRSQDELWDNGY